MHHHDQSLTPKRDPFVQPARFLITGGSQGIGAAIVELACKAGHQVVFTARNQPLIDTIARKTGAHGLRADVALEDDNARTVEVCAERMGGVDVLVNNAGIQHTAPCETFPPEKWDAILATNLSAAFHAMRTALPHMRRRGWGRIVNTASVHGLVASVNKAAYVAAKHGLVGLTKVVALETAGSGITCNAICPGWTRTELVEPQIAARAKALGVALEEGARDLLSEKQPSKQFVTVDELGAVVAFLCSDAAAQITGASIPIDGGWTAQ
jgi:3-hydroxybutyrate dehydrogenase